MSGQDLQRQHPLAWASLGASKGTIYLAALAGAAVGWGVLHGLGLSLQGKAGALAGAIPVAGLVLFPVIAYVVARRQKLAFLARLPLPLDRASYFAALDGRAETGALALDIQLDGDASPLISTTLPTSRLDTAAGSATVVSPTFRTVVGGYTGRYHDNRALHRWFVRAVEQVLLPLSRQHQLVAIRARFVDGSPAR